MGLELIESLFKEYIEDPTYVYKASGPSNIIILRKSSETQTNEMRNNISNAKYASYRADKLLVVKIFDKLDPQTTKQKVKGTFYMSNRINYKVGEFTEADSFDEDIKNVATNGIHYYKSIEVAYYKNIFNTKNYSGIFKAWFYNGNLKKINKYIDGKLTFWTNYFNVPSQIVSETCECDGEFADGNSIEYHENGSIKCKGKYFNGDKIGIWEHYLST